MMSRLNSKVEEENLIAFLSAEKEQEHKKAVALWLRSRPEVGVLVGKTEGYYVYPSSGQYSEIEVFDEV